MIEGTRALLDLRLRCADLRGRLRKLETRIARLEVAPGCPCGTCRGVRALQAWCRSTGAGGGNTSYRPRASSAGGAR